MSPVAGLPQVLIPGQVGPLSRFQPKVTRGEAVQQRRHLLAGHLLLRAEGVCSCSSCNSLLRAPLHIRGIPGTLRHVGKGDTGALQFLFRRSSHLVEHRHQHSSVHS